VAKKFKARQKRTEEVRRNIPQGDVLCEYYLVRHLGDAIVDQ